MLLFPHFNRTTLTWRECLSRLVRIYNLSEFIRELLRVPEDLRYILEQCLSEEATPSNLEIYLPTVRKTITDLLQGLREKQSLYRSIVTDRKHRTTSSQVSEGEGRSNRSSRAGSVVSSRASNMIRASSANDAYNASDSQQRRVSRKREPSSTVQLPVPPSQTEGRHFPDGRIVQDGGTPSQRKEQLRPPASQGRPPKDYQQLQRVKSTPNSPSNSDDPNDTTITASSPPSRSTSPSMKTVLPVPPNVVRYSLSDNPVPSVFIDGATPPTSSESVATMSQEKRQSSASSSNAPSTPPETPQVEPEQQPFIDSSLAALKKSDALERRASKRFSTYNISKMTGTGLRERPGMGKHANRRSMAADSKNLTPGDLTVLTEEDETPKPSVDVSQSRNKDIARMRTPTPIDEGEEVPPVPALPSNASTSSLNLPPLISRGSSESVERRKEASSGAPASKFTEGDSTTVSVFLQLGREVKKVTIEKGLSFASLRVLFVDKFSYSPGQGNFPDIYIRDPSSGVMYELEDVEEVKDKCLLSLNIDRKWPLSG